ncbi:helix-hairpin-helix domain-containing protein [Parvicella tangerina]|uniref:Helix-hairpin-helix domain-containing protein n=1 Tax=Parvicella tangerina TaxID=2829795 RepID=A0A916JK11_9FLAO|nr:helix-hairpin-helix domain-containing protein [Parvicella tangerina]CAG5078133.1 hypothetical protein CRYO30217_00586 [Parvicella tangerina]
MLSPLQNYFHYSRGERRGTVALLIIITILLLFYFFRGWVFQENRSEVDIAKFESKITSFEAQKNAELSKQEIAYFMFDPNTIGVEEWKALGFSEKQAASIENYKASGAQFKVKKDVLKLFMVDEYKYAQLEPYIDLPTDYPDQQFEKYDDHGNYKDYDNETLDFTAYGILLAESKTPIYDGFDKLEGVHYTKKQGVYQYLLMPFENKADAEVALLEVSIPEAEIVELKTTKGYYPVANNSGQESIEKDYKELIIELNKADTTILKKLYGIGSGYAKRIVKYREALGGFVNLNQLSEVYGLKPETIENILPHLVLKNPNTKKINVNTATTDDLKAHPYIDWKVANSIVQIRNNYGKFASIDEITKSVLIDDELYNRLKPYLKAE